jgi:histidyl-tRNA synthetase
MPKHQLPSGFIEYTPEEQVEFNHILDTIREEYEHAGFTPIETASIGYSEVILAKAGGELDKEIYRFQKGDRDLSLRFDLTVPLARYIAEHNRNMVLPAKIYQIGKSWRAEKPQKGRYRELYQADIDILGNNSRLAEAEMLSVIQNIFAILELPAIIFRVSNRKILAGLLDSYSITDISSILRIVDKKAKLSEADWIQALRDIQTPDLVIDILLSLFENGKNNQEIIELLQQQNIDNVLYQEGIDELIELIQYLDSFQIKDYSIDISIVRGQDYYTGTVFESFLEGLESFGSICSGGRYDNLVGHYINTPITGFGASIGVSRLFGILREQNWFQEIKYGDTTKIGIFLLNENTVAGDIESIIALRDEQGIAFDLYPEITNFKKALQYANRKNYTEAIFFGGDEAKAGEVLVKNMESGEQEIILLEDLGEIE